MTTAADVWSQLKPALDEVRAQYVRDSQTPWSTVRGQLTTTLSSTDEQVRTTLLDWLEAMSDSDRIELLTGDRMESLLPTVLTEVGAQETYDKSAWQAFLTTNGPAWDCTALTWTAFREWFAYQAGQQGFSAPGKDLLSYLEPLSVPDRVTAFARYGVTLTPPTASAAPDGGEFGWVTPQQQSALRGGWGERWATELATDLATRWGAGWQQRPNEHKTAWLADLIAAGTLPPVAAVVAATPDSSSVVASLPAELASGLLAEVPDLTELSEAEIAEVVAEVLRETEV